MADETPRQRPPYGVCRSEPGATKPFARVRYRSGEVDVPEALYREDGLTPDFDSLPTFSAFRADEPGAR